LFDIFARIDRTFRSDSKSLIFIDIGYAVKLWEADKVRQSAICWVRALTSCQNIYYAACALLHVEALHFPASNPLRNATRFCWTCNFLSV